LASGLDTSAIIQALLAVESRPLFALEDRKEAERNRLSLYGTLEGLVTTLRNRAREFTSALSSFYAYSVSPSDESIANFTITGKPLSGSHTLEVLSLARADRWAFEGQPDADTTQLGNGTISFDYGGTSYSVAIDGATSTLNDVAAAISTEADGAVIASVVNTGTQDNPSYRLVLAGEETGADHTIDNLTASFGALGVAEHVSTASNARAIVDGLTVERSTNLFEGVFEGISFTALATTDQEIAVGVEIDVEETRTKFQGLVDAYNAVVKFINDQNRFSEERGASGPLFGDAALSTVGSALRRALFDVDLSDVLADTEGYSTLGLLGLDLRTDGTISIDAADFERKLTQNPELFEAAFSGDDGVFTALHDAAGELLLGPTDENGDPILVLGKAIKGLFDSRRDTLNKVIKGLDDQIDRMELRLDKLEESLIARFANLEQLLGSLNAQQGFLAQNLTFPGQR
jgi:flagellar hook-associated protein 2